MPEVQLRNLVNDAVQASDAATYELELPNSGKLHSLLLTAACTNGATSARALTILDVVDLVEIVGDGSEVLYSMTPQEIEKWAETLSGNALESIEEHGASLVQSMVFPILFGRKLFDPECYLPLGAFKQTKLRVTYSPTIAADNGFTTGTTTFDVKAFITPDDQSLPYMGTLTTKRIKDFTSLAAGDDLTDLPRNNPIRAIGVYAYEANTADGTDVTRVQLRANNGERVLFDADWPNFLDINRNLFGCEIFHTARLLQTDAETWDCRLGYVRQVVIEPIYTPSDANDTFSTFNASGYTGDRITIQIRDADVTAGAETFAVATADYRMQVTAYGKSPSFFGLIPFLYQDVKDWYLQSNQYSKLELLLTQGGAGATVRVSLQELRQFNR